METVFPSDKGYDGFFVVGVRKDLNSLTTIQRTGTVILKRTYDIDPLAGMLSPSAMPLAVFMRDQPDNLLINSDFESPLFDDKGNPIDWQPEGVTIAPETDPDDADNHFLQVVGAASGRVVQTLTFEEPLGGRPFVFSFSAKADADTQIQGVQLEADGDDGLIVICAKDANLDTDLARHSETGAWPPDLAATEMRVVLRMAADAAHTVSYDNVQVEERDYETMWDPATTLRYEHDLAAFKPEGDVIVLGFTEMPSPPPPAGVDVRVLVDNDEWFRRTLNGDRQKAVFGWEPRVASARKDEAGTFDPLPSDTLPADFNNLFYNGYRRANLEEGITANSPFSYLPKVAQIEIKRDDIVDYRFTLRGDTAAATYYYTGIGSDEESNWRSQSVTMNLDTLVIEPENNRCYAVWRGVWPFDNHPEDAYRRLVVEASA